MFTGGEIEIGTNAASGRAQTNPRPPHVSPRDQESQDRALNEADCWQLHAQLRDKAHQRVVLEAEESDLLLLAEECLLFKKLGYVCMAEYMERELGYGSRHAANERLRVAHELLELRHRGGVRRAGAGQDRRPGPWCPASGAGTPPTRRRIRR